MRVVVAVAVMVAAVLLAILTSAQPGVSAQPG